MFKLERWVLCILLPLIVILSVGLYLLHSDSNYRWVESTGGVCALTGVDFEAGELARTRGEVEYVPGALLTPEEFAASDQILLGSAYEVGPVLTSRLRIQVPEGRLYALCSTTANFASRIYVNGLLLEEYGHPGLTAAEALPGQRYIRFTARPEHGVIEIVQQSSNFVFWEQSDHTAWTVGTPNAVDTYADRYQNTYYAAIGGFMILFLIHLGLFLMLRSYRANLYFALLCLVWVIRTGVIGPKVFASLFPALPWAVAFRLEYLSLPAALTLFLLAYHTLFPGVIQRGARLAVYGLSGGFAALYLLADTYTMSLTIRYLEAGMVLTGLYVLIRLLWKVRRPAVEQRIVLAGFAIALAALTWDSFYYSVGPVGILASAVNDAAILLISLFQITAMLFGTMRQAGEAWRREQALKLENEALDRENLMRLELLHNLSHETRTPLAVMSVYAQLTVGAIREGTVDEQTIQDLDVISKEAKRLAEMASGVMELFEHRQREEKRTAFSLPSLLRQLSGLCRSMVEKGGNTLVFHLPEELPSVWGDPDGCTQLVWNLLSNACAHTREGTITISAVPEGDFLSVTVADTGEGMPPELLAHVLERGVSATPGGHGFGLSICRRIVEEHGGSLCVESEQGVGTTVRFTLPIYREEATDESENHSVGG